MKADLDMNPDEKVFITPAQAKSLLSDSEKIHTFRSATGMLIGCDWDRSSILREIDKNPNRIEIGGEVCKRMGHGLIVWTSEADPLFIEADKGKVRELEELLTK